jgi:hypothetical protein
VEQAEKRHGGYRPGAGRKSKYGVKTVVMRIPENRVHEVQSLIGGGSLESVTESKDEAVTESVESVTDLKRSQSRTSGASSSDGGSCYRTVNY